MKKLLELSYRQCRWPVAQDRGGEHLFCGARTESGCSYCKAHHEISVERNPPEWWLEIGDWLEGKP